MCVRCGERVRYMRICVMRAPRHAEAHMKVIECAARAYDGDKERQDPVRDKMRGKEVPGAQRAAICLLRVMSARPRSRYFDARGARQAQ